MYIRFFLIILLLFAAFVANAFANPFPDRHFASSPEKPSYGMSYSFEQAGWYGLDPRTAYVDLLDRYNFSWVRLPFFWNQMTDESGNLKIDDLEFAISEAEKRNVKVVVALGLKTPYYPEFHLPPKIGEKIKFGDVITASHPVAPDVLEINKKLVSALSKYPNISHWQVENEPFLANIDQVTIDKSLLEQEIKVVREADPSSRPVMLSNAARSFYDKKYRDLLSLLSPGDVVAVNAYFVTQGVDLLAVSPFGREIHLSWPVWFSWPVQSWGFLSPDYETIKSDSEAVGVDVWITEMQAEPYIRSIEAAEGSNFTFAPSDIARADSFMRSKGFGSVGFWGAHFWQFREKNGDLSWSKSVIEVTSK